MHYFGAHIDSYDDIVGASDRIRKAGGNFIQLFMTIPGEQLTREKSVNELLKMKAYLDKNNMRAVIHSAYIHNLARSWDSYSWWMKNIELEIKYAYYIGAIGIVIHFGKKLELTKEEAYNNMYTSLIYIHNKTLEYKNVKIILETPTGQGTELCYDLNDLSYFFNKFKNNVNKEIKDRFGLCIDTCHIFSAGYDIRTKEDVKNYLQQFEDKIGLRYVKLIHLNDCKVNIGEKKDRHQNIGSGYIGMTGLKHVYKYFKKLNVPIVLETPNHGYKDEINLLKNK